MGVGETLLTNARWRSPVTAAAVAVAVVLSARLAETSAQAAPPGLVEAVEPGVTIDWQQGTVTAQAGRAAELRMPSPDVARLGAERHARASARSRLERALRALPLGSGRRLDEQAVARALVRARGAVEYQSNGGAVVTLEVRFGDWSTPLGSSADGGAGAEPSTVAAAAGPDQTKAAAPSSPEVSFRVTSARLAAAPLVVAGTREVPLAYARYRLGPPSAGDGVLRARVDDRGRLVVDDKSRSGRVDDLVEDLAGRPALIYVQKPQR